MWKRSSFSIYIVRELLLYGYMDINKLIFGYLLLVLFLFILKEVESGSLTGYGDGR